jgi:hypothetical protein
MCIGDNLLFRSYFGELVRRRDDLPRPPGVAVAEVLRDEGAGADEVVVLVEEEAGPGELPGAGLPVLPAGGGAPLARAALLAARHHLLRAVLPPGALGGGLRLLGGDAGPSEHRQVHVCNLEL